MPFCIYIILNPINNVKNYCRRHQFSLYFQEIDSCAANVGRYLFISTYSLQNAATVLMLDNTSLAIPPAMAYFICSRAAEFDETCTKKVKL